MFLRFLILLLLFPYACFANSSWIKLSHAPDYSTAGSRVVKDAGGITRSVAQRDYWAEDAQFIFYEKDKEGNNIYDGDCDELKGYTGCLVEHDMDCTQDNFISLSGDVEICPEYTSTINCSHQPSTGDKEIISIDSKSDYSIASWGKDYSECKFANTSNCVRYGEQEETEQEGDCTVDVELEDGKISKQKLKSKDRGRCNKYKVRYACKSADGVYNDSCASLVAKEQKGLCRKVGTTCLEKGKSKHCEYEEIDYECTDKSIKFPDILECSTAQFCLGDDKDCQKAQRDEQGGFGEAASALQLMANLKKDLGVDGECFAPEEGQDEGDNRRTGTKFKDPEQCRIFEGEALRCNEDFAKYSHCCNVTPEGFGVDLKLKSCGDNAAKLSAARGNGLCHYIGRYCGEKKGFCLSHKQSFCCYRSKFIRILHEQAVDKENGNKITEFGNDSKSPNCGQFTIGDFDRIDFDKLDFSELESDIRRKAQSNLGKASLSSDRIKSTGEALHIQAKQKILGTDGVISGFSPQEASGLLKDKFSQMGLGDLSRGVELSEDEMNTLEGIREQTLIKPQDKNIIDKLLLQKPTSELNTQGAKESQVSQINDFASFSKQSQEKFNKMSGGNNQ